MEDYESQYEEYKQAILHNRRLRNELHENYQGSLRVEKDYIDENGVLWKTCILSGVCGLCLGLFWILEDISTARSIITRIVLAAIMIVCFYFAMRIGKKFKKDLGEMVFYAFRYHKYFKDHTKSDRDKESKELERDALNHYDAIRWREDSIQNMSEEEIKSLFLWHINKMGDFKQRYKDLSRYDRFAEELKNDYYFNAEIQKDIDKYI